ncbi:geranylgeranyl reductase family protein [Haloquadratum walsbyi]|jgi:2,3-di-O-geranylgeranylglyceryl phosphate reductase (EC 1.3.99.-)|uniref:Geranylgeranyl reductase family n=1 Tax=Haloquadratum walsbyi J07HQW2 TaxID=1238425 RepID=U1NH85_9EURY|nr:geranylgeranyl reductase family protein [Haloquadratum walsbyi]ERG96520.1 MAG: geranylgeranyl reductase family [Haloquadratum walsbyi J07HQW2]
MSTSHEHDIVIVGAGTVGCYAAATAADAGLDVIILERKTASEAGHIACGDALKGANKFPEAIPKSQLDSAFTNTGVDHGRFEIPQEDTVVEIPVPGELAVIDRLEYGDRLIEAAETAGTTFQYDTVVQDVIQNDSGTVTGVKATNGNGVTEYNADIVIDGAGALSILQDKADFSNATFDTNVSYSQFSSAYREIIEVDEPVEWDDALVFKPTERAAGYLWYFPRTKTTINAGLGFQMSEEPMNLVDDLARDLRQRSEFKNATVKDKLGASLPTRRPYDSAVAPGFLAAGDAAGHVNPTTGGGIAGAAFAGMYAGEQAVTAISEGDVSEASLWEYNERVMGDFGTRFAGLDVYNVLSTAIDVDELMGLIASLPGEKLAEALYSGTTSFSPLLILKTIKNSYGHWRQILNFYRTKNLADDLMGQYERYPNRPEALDGWKSTRDEIMDQIYDVTGAEVKY